jgi:hypothetical protein
MTPIECSTLARTLDLVRFFRRLDLVHNTAVAVAKVNEVLGLGGVLPDHGSLAAVSLIAPHAGLVATQQIGQHSAVGDIGWRRHSRADQVGAAVDAKMRLQNVAKPRQNPTPSPLLPMRGPRRSRSGALRQARDARTLIASAWLSSLNRKLL